MVETRNVFLEIRIWNQKKNLRIGVTTPQTQLEEDFCVWVKTSR